MRSQSHALSLNEGDYGFTGFLRRQVRKLAGTAILIVVAAIVAALATWNVADPSFSHATDNPVTNAAGYPGAVVSDILMQFFGLGSVVVLVPAIVWAIGLVLGRRILQPGKRALAWFGAAAIGAGIIGCVGAPPTWPLPSGLGGVFGDIVLALPGRFIGAYPSGMAGFVTAALLFLPAGGLLYVACNALGTLPAERRKTARKVAVQEEADEDDYDDDYEEDGEGRRFLALGAVAHMWLSAHAFLKRHGALPNMSRRRRDDEFDAFDELATRPAGRVEPGFEAMRGAPSVEPPFDADDIGLSEDDLDLDTPVPSPQEIAARRAQAAPARAAAPRAVQRAAQPMARHGNSGFEMPHIEFLSEPRALARDASLSQDALNQNARILEGVLEDFGVKGEIIQVRPGPVVTLYELEPAPGIKSSRVIGLADDIARSMSAIAARVAVVPGRNAIGIELPNARRETVYLREMLASQDFATTKAKLALALGKSINGDAVIVDIAKMPHVLVAGTTGSGKSVAINTMILSLLYRMTPDECRLIMIDPKMLELSVYDGIPHLLTPVVTDPKKAVVALKWTVREMEDRYRKMSKVGVRNIDGFNQRVATAEKKGEQISRTVQTGFDRETGEAIYETEHLELERMPYIVVIIDEMADLMMVAGKDIEGAVQRLAQMARAAGIHVIMATQRPSVDVITGTIKANFPTRMSFQVTSKIDSRTILGEQGAEQLLGMGDMLYMAGGGRIQRVHGPFVSDDEVEKVVAHLKLQGVPEYLDSITEDDGEDEDGGASAKGGSSGNSNLDDSDDPYDQAVSVVLRDGKASTSYIQRRLGIGYNRAASIIEKMEQEGIVGPANHAGKREILVPTEEETY
ncbi:cell division protein FtsK [Aliihoeflea aestuarii]|uniref:FtsK/SpoIIIE family DNA translocase n=1 Tax=Aliihoeflea aestuarii TaxID=453840 RepID=UPI002092A4AA|nr:DNA translocase FtsK [Aliihoeflea aestuarii]MCO6391410.1 cell division protein FtsK [Aliihoeflea aestuarii]